MLILKRIIFSQDGARHNQQSPVRGSLRSEAEAGLVSSRSRRREATTDVRSDCSGGFSVVKLCVEKSTGKEYAAKIINKKRVVAVCFGHVLSTERRFDFPSLQDLHRLPTELEILRSVNHPNIIQLKDVFETKEYVYIVTEL